MDVDESTSSSWTVWLRRRLARTVPEGQALPDRQPAYVQSWIYVFGVATLAALVFVIASGVALALGGAMWWHTSSIGHFVNSMHLWSVELFFVFMVVHLWGKFFMAAWRGRRALTWITGAVAFVGSIGTAFTGYLSQTNYDSQWISTQAKDGLNSVGVGSVFNVLPGFLGAWIGGTLAGAITVPYEAHVLTVLYYRLTQPAAPILPEQVTKPWPSIWDEERKEGPE